MSRTTHRCFICKLNRVTRIIIIPGVIASFVLFIVFLTVFQIKHKDTLNDAVPQFQLHHGTTLDDLNGFNQSTDSIPTIPINKEADNSQFINLSLYSLTEQRAQTLRMFFQSCSYYLFSAEPIIE